MYIYRSTFLLDLCYFSVALTLLIVFRVLEDN